jgi:hypothetical protein
MLITSANTTFETTINTGLVEGQKYYFRAYATNAVGTTYGEEKSFMTLSKIETTLTSTTNTITPEIDIISAITPGNRGIIWNLTDTGLTTTLGTKTVDTTTIPSSTPSTLTPNTKYYVVGYVTNDGGTYYESVKNITTLPKFISGLTNTSSTTNISAAISILKPPMGNVIQPMGNVIQGTELITAKGIAYGTSTSTAPTTLQLASTPSTGPFGYTTNITGLTIGTKYYYRPYATNAAGTSYGEEKTFTTLADVQLPELSSISSPITSLRVILSVIGTTIINPGGQLISGSGLCYGTNISPTTSNNISPNISNNTPFNTNINFSVGTYYIRAYVTNVGGTAYSTSTIKLAVTNVVSEDEIVTSVVGKITII